MRSFVFLFCSLTQSHSNTNTHHVFDTATSHQSTNLTSLTLPPHLISSSWSTHLICFSSTSTLNSLQLGEPARHQVHPATPVLGKVSQLCRPLRSEELSHETERQRALVARLLEEVQRCQRLGRQLAGERASKWSDRDSKTHPSQTRPSGNGPAA